MREARFKSGRAASASSGGIGRDPQSLMRRVWRASALMIGAAYAPKHHRVVGLPERRRRRPHEDHDRRVQQGARRQGPDRRLDLRMGRAVLHQGADFGRRGQGPDVMTYHESRMPLGVSTGALSALTPEELSASGIKPSDFSPANWKAAQGPTASNTPCRSISTRSSSTTTRTS